jgi:post-segregation antitoxin (ccd killing protein)
MIKRSLKEEAEELGINIREIIEKTLEEEIKRVKNGEVEESY